MYLNYLIHTTPLYKIASTLLACRVKEDRNNQSSLGIQTQIDQSADKEKQSENRKST